MNAASTRQQPYDKVSHIDEVKAELTRIRYLRGHAFNSAPPPQVYSQLARRNECITMLNLGFPRWMKGLLLLLSISMQ